MSGLPTASLPMYNLPEMQAANARLWEALRGPTPKYNR